MGSLDGKQIYRSERSGDIHSAEIIGLNVAEDLLSQGAGKILEELKLQSSDDPDTKA